MRKRVTSLVLALSLAAAMPVAADDTPRFKSSGFLESLGLFSDQRAHLNPDDRAPSGLKVDFAFRGEPAAQEPGFLYFQDSDESAPVRPVPISRPSNFTPRMTAIGGLDDRRDARGDARMSGSFTPRAGSAEVRLSLVPASGEERKALSLTLHSDFLVEQTPGLQGSDFFGGLGELSPTDRRSQAFGMTLAWLGFKVGASMSREEGGLPGDVQGFDLGLGYQWSAFSTELSFGDYNSRDSALIGLANDNFTRLELGAAYAISERLRVSGGIKLFDYSNRFDLAGNSADHSGLLYLGTRFNF